MNWALGIVVGGKTEFLLINQRSIFGVYLWFNVSENS